MIPRHDMLAVLLAACPSFAPRWRALQDEWREDAPEPPPYTALGDFAQHLVALVEGGETSELPAVFAAVERLHVEGEHDVRVAATVGLLEDLQNPALYKTGGDREQFRPYLGPVSERWWNKLYRFWEHGELLGEG